MEPENRRPRRPQPNTLELVLLGLGILLVAALGVYGYRWITTPLHPDARGVPSVLAAPPAPRWADAVARGQALVRASLVRQNLPGLSVAAGIGGEVVWAEGFGWADLDERVPVAPSMRFRIGGASIPLTSAAVGLLLEDGRLELDEPIRTYVPAFPEKAWPVTLRELMAHVAGVRHFRGEGDFMPSAHCDRAVEGLRSFAQDPLSFQPGTRFLYSTFGWVLVSAAVEAAADEPFDAFLRARVLAPLGMLDTLPDVAAQPLADRVTFYYPRLNADLRYGPETASVVDLSSFAGGGGYLSTPTDLVRFGLALGGGELLEPDTVRRLQAPQTLSSGEETGYGLGWDLETVSIAGTPTQLVGHDGELTMGGSTSLLMWPERGIVVAVTANISYADTFSIAAGIVEVLAGRTNPQDEPGQPR